MSGRWPRTAVIAMGCLVCLSGIARGAQLELFIITNAPPPCLADGGNPMSVTVFRPTDMQAFVWFKVAGLQPGDTAKVEWIDPAGQVFKTGYWEPVTGIGVRCFDSSPFKIAEAVPPLTPGTWRVRVYMNTTQLATGTFTILEPCRCSVSPTSFSFERGAGSGSVTVSTDASCRWTASTTANWIFITSELPGTGNGTVTFRVGANTGAARTGTITISGQTVTVTQSGIAVTPQVVYSRMLRSMPAPCSFENPPANVTTFLSTDAEAYLWLAIDNVKIGDVLALETFNPAGAKYATWSFPWLPSSYSGRVCFPSSALKIAGAAPASLPGAWVMKLTMNGAPLLTLTFTIQAVWCSCSLNPGSQSAPAEGGSFSVSVNTGAGCPWTAVSNAGWISIQSGSSGGGGGTVAYRVAANTGSASRSGTLSIAGQTLTVTQAPACAYSIDPASASMAAAGGTGSVSVKTTSGCRWTAVSNASWLYITAGAGGTGNASVSYSASPNPGASERSGTLTAAGQTFTVRQAAGNLFSQALLSTAVGTDWTFSKADAPAVDAPLGDLKGVTVDPYGYLYIADSENCMVFRLGSDGMLGLVAGNGICGYSGDGGRATSASLSYPYDAQVDAEGNLYISDYYNHRIRKVTLDGIISTFAGNGTAATKGDGGPAVQASLPSPRRLGMDAEGNLYVGTDYRIRRISRDGGVISTVAGNGEARFAGDGGRAIDASLSFPEGIAFDAAGNMYVSDWTDCRIRRITTDGMIGTFAGDGQCRFAGDGGAASKASLRSPNGLAMDHSGNLFVADVNNRRIRKIAPDGVISTVAGNGNIFFEGDGGPATRTSLFWPDAVATDATGSIYIADTRNGRIRKVAPDGIIQTVAGNGLYRAVADGSSALDVYMTLPRGFTRDAQGNIYIADTNNHRVWKVSPDGVATLFAGIGAPSCCVDGGPAVKGMLSGPTDVAVDARGDVYIADGGNHRIRKVGADGKISTWGGTGEEGSQGDGGPVSKAQLNYPIGLVFDPAGYLYIADAEDHKVRRVAPDGTITTVAGTGEAGYSGDNGLAAKAKLYYPWRVAPDRAGNLYIADYYNCRIRKVTPGGIITTVAGTSGCGYSGDGGLATQAKLWGPQGVAVDPAGNIYITDGLNHRVRMVSPNGVITTVAGNGRAGFSGDGGPALSGSLNRPVDLEVTADALYILEYQNNRLRVVRTSVVALESAPAVLAFTAQADSGILPPQAVRVTSSSAGLQYSATVITESGGNWLRVGSASGTAPGTVQVTVSSDGLAADTYRGTVRVTAAGGAVRTIAVTFQVQESNPPKMDFEPKEFRLSIAEQSQAEDVLWVLNRGGGLLSFSADAGGDAWLKVTSSAAKATASEPGVVTLGIDARSLAPGTYTGTVTLSTASGDRRQVPVTLAVVGSRKPKLLASHKAVAFLSRAGGGDAPHDVSIVNIGQGVMAWSAEAQSDRGWLSIASSGGTTDADAAAVPVVRVSANPGALGPGEYTGQITIRAPDAEDGVQRIDAKLTIVRDESQLAPIVRPTGMIFRAVNPSAPPGSQEISIFNITSRPVKYDAGLTPQSAVEWLQLKPASGAVPEFTSRQQNTAILKVQPMLQDAQGAGLSEATLTVKMGSINRTINLYLFQPAASGGRSAAGVRSADGGCAATVLYPIFTTLESSGFEATVGRAVSINVSVVDDCGAPVTAGSVLAAFSNGDAGIPLVSLKDGRWAGSWLPKSPAKHVGITVRAWRPGDNLRGETQPPLTGNVSAP